ncbi:hypothetical protein EGW08_000210 [Elysia chlorotica]|uniref:Uncharacterized protein n=1 Tax=Elysia chlorotica TaxID=188477 RepID=A0A3S1BN22_ELYCH|nr:hypothetical protein EGW08_000210 [Elysia chlorotica]
MAVGWRKHWLIRTLQVKYNFRASQGWLIDGSDVCISPRNMKLGRHHYRSNRKHQRRRQATMTTAVSKQPSNVRNVLSDHVGGPTFLKIFNEYKVGINNVSCQSRIAPLCGLVRVEHATVVLIMRVIPLLVHVCETWGRLWRKKMCGDPAQVFGVIDVRIITPIQHDHALRSLFDEKMVGLFAREELKKELCSMAVLRNTSVTKSSLYRKLGRHHYRSNRKHQRRRQATMTTAVEGAGIVSKYSQGQIRAGSKPGSARHDEKIRGEYERPMYRIENDYIVWGDKGRCSCLALLYLGRPMTIDSTSADNSVGGPLFHPPQSHTVQISTPSQTTSGKR